MASKSEILCSNLEPLDDSFDPVNEVEHCADHQYMYANEELADRREQDRINNAIPRDRSMSPEMIQFYSFVGVAAVTISVLVAIIYMLS